MRCSRVGKGTKQCSLLFAKKFPLSLGWGRPGGGKQGFQLHCRLSQAKRTGSLNETQPQLSSLLNACVSIVIMDAFMVFGLDLVPGYIGVSI